MAMLQNQPLKGSVSAPLSDVSLAAGDLKSDDAFAPELPPLVLGSNSRSTRSAKQPVADSVDTNTLSQPTTSFFRPQSSSTNSQDFSGASSTGQNSFSPPPDLRGSGEVPPVGINPPQFGNSNQGSFSGNGNRSFENERGSSDGFNNSNSQQPEGNYYDPRQNNSFAPPSGSASSRSGNTNSSSSNADGSQTNNDYRDLDPNLLRPESAYGSRRTPSQSTRTTDPSTLQSPGLLPTTNGRSLNNFPALKGSAGGNTFFPSLPGTAIGIGPGALGASGLGSRIEPSIGLGHNLGHNGTCGCDRCRVATKETCRTCCQPLCVTRTILVPELYTFYRTVNETHYRPEVREIPYFREEAVTHRVPVIEKFPVTIKEPRIRNFKTYRKEEYQSPREVNYTSPQNEIQNRQGQRTGFQRVRGHGPAAAEANHD